MFKLSTFRSNAAFWPLAEPGKPTNAAQPHPFLWVLIAALARLAAALLSEIKARRAMQTLADLDERMLRDIGIEREQIPPACRHGREALLRPDLARWA